jgi:hypothetical protein
MGAVWRFDLGKERGEPVRLAGVKGGRTGSFACGVGVARAGGGYGVEVEG